MHISRNSWYVRLYFLMARINAGLRGIEGPLQDPTDVCPMVRMILLWGPLSIIVQLLKVALVIGILLAIVGVVVGFSVMASSMPFAVLVTKLLHGLLEMLAVIVVMCVLLSLTWCVIWATVKIRQSAVGHWWRSHFPKRHQPAATGRASKGMGTSNPSSGPNVFFVWLDGQLHGWCSRLTIVD